MREYTIAAIVVLVFALIAAGSRGLWLDRSFWLGMAIFAILTIGCDVLMISVGLFGYATVFRSGLGIGPMPIEDLAYGLALYLVAVTAWRWDDRRAR